MNLTHTVIGQKHKWSLERKLGEGDAGEVFLVRSLLEGETGILKRPRKGGFSADVIRQAAQIKNEGQLLKAMEGMVFPESSTCLSVPAMLDQSTPEQGSGERFFIVMGPAAGFSLQSIFRLVYHGAIEDEHFLAGEEAEGFLGRLSGCKKIPEPILIRILYGILNLLETIHATEVTNEGVKRSGLIWNDIKPEHLYWDPYQTRLTVIDWGNGSFLDSDGITKDRHHSPNDDYNQFVKVFGGFLAESNPELLDRLDWPQDLPPGNARSGIVRVKEKIVTLHGEVLDRKQELLDLAVKVYDTSRPALRHLSRSDSLAQKTIELGEMPDFASAANFYARVALKVSSENKLEAFREVCERGARLLKTGAAKWNLLAEIAGIAHAQSAARENGQEHLSIEAFSSALMSGVTGDWPAMIWDLFALAGKGALPDWWERISSEARRIYLNLNPDALTPFVTVSRLFYTLQATVLEFEDRGPNDNLEGNAQVHSELIKILEEEVLAKWKELKPAPPNSGLGYWAVFRILEDIEAILPGSIEKVTAALSQPESQSEIVLGAWDRKDFATARKALRMVLIWDPDLRRLIQADQSVVSAPEWLAKVRRGAEADEPFYDYLTSVELAGRNLRNRVGKANWLDSILDALKQLRKGARPADLIMGQPEITKDIPWLNEYRSREILSLTRNHALALERDKAVAGWSKLVNGIVEGNLGPDRDLSLGEPLDTWIPEARGSSARVFAGYLRREGKQPIHLAIKIIRPDQVDYALPLFREEAHILSLLRDVPGVTPLVECGFMKLIDGQEVPADDGRSSGEHLRGELIRYGIEEVQNFLAGLDRQLSLGWLPYLGLVKRDQDQNLMVYCDAGHTHGWFLPLLESLVLSIQICDILQQAHDRNIVYRDHKILHYYWDPDTHGVAMIDWNISKRVSHGLSDAERRFDIVQFGARALHHILTGRPAPGALPLGPNRPEEIEHASQKYPVNWTYDDERLPIQVKEILERVLNQGYSQIKDLRSDLEQVYKQLTEAVPLPGVS